MPDINKIYLKYTAAAALIGLVIGYLLHLAVTKIVIVSLLTTLYPTGTAVIADKVPIDIGAALSNVGLVSNASVALCSSDGQHTFFFPHKAKTGACNTRLHPFKTRVSLTYFTEPTSLYVKYSPLEPVMVSLVLSTLFSALAFFSLFIFFRQQGLKQKIQQKSELADLAKQLAHDIRSPIAALNAALFSLDKDAILSKNLIQGTLVRIREIADDLLISYSKKEYKTDEFFSVKSTLQQLIDEKKILYKDIVFEINNADKKDILLNINKSYFQRALSNFINNSIEAKCVNQNLVIKFVITSNGISIIDNGTGMDQDFVAKLLSGTSQSTKTSGYGIGFFGSKKLLENMGLKVKVTSSLNSGTTIYIDTTSIEIKS